MGIKRTVVDGTFVPSGTLFGYLRAHDVFKCGFPVAFMGVGCVFIGCMVV